jgi:3-isopropylmalate/(R)-2-methylmalate dehydratase small subunit
MEPLIEFEGVAVPFNRANVDTDQIIPARFIMKPRKFDYSTVLFHDQPLDRAALRGATLIVTGENFACGSAREQAVWALQDWGIRVVIGPSFGGIFYGNCMKNGVLPAIVERDVAQELCGKLERGATLRVNLPDQLITTADGQHIRFDIDEGHKAQLLSGKDDITRTLEHEAAIVAHERASAAASDWSRPSFDEAIGTRRHIPVAKA